jgi:hypothetical protein
MSYTKEQVEKILKETLKECLSGINQESGVKSVIYDAEKQECTVKLSVVIVEDDNFVGFSGY